MAINLATLLDEAERLLINCSTSPRLDAEVLLAYVMQTSRTYLYTWPEQFVADEQQKQFMSLLQRRKQGEPIAYLVGHCEFWSLSFSVTPDTLIPRSETELLVETALKLFGAQENIAVLELGTGSGAIAIALATEKPSWRIIATDISDKALNVAKANAQTHQCRNISFIQSDWFNALTAQQFHLIISNPPYIASHDPHLKHLSFEPQHALVAPDNGLKAFEVIATHAKNFLDENGYLMFEHGYEQAEKVRAILKNKMFHNINTFLDYHFVERVTIAKKKF